MSTKIGSGQCNKVETLTFQHYLNPCVNGCSINTNTLTL